MPFPIDDDTTKVAMRTPPPMPTPLDRMDIADERAASMDMTMATSQTLYRMECRVDDLTDRLERTLARSRAQRAELAELSRMVEASQDEG